MANICGWNIDLQRANVMFDIEASDTVCFIFDAYDIDVGVTAGSFAIYTGKRHPVLRFKSTHMECPCFHDAVYSNRAGTLLCVTLLPTKSLPYYMFIDLRPKRFAIVKENPYPRRLQQVPCYIPRADAPCESVQTHFGSLPAEDVGPHCLLDDVNVTELYGLAWHPASEIDDSSEKMRQ